MKIVMSLLFLFCVAASAAPYQSDVFYIVIPDGFEGPVVETQGPNSKIVVFAWKCPDQVRSTYLKIASFDLANSLHGVSETKRHQIINDYLVKLKATFAQRRDTFRMQAHQPTVLGGTEAFRTEWSGSIGGHGVSGVIYYLILDSQVLAFFTQAYDAMPSEHTLRALEAIEAVVLQTGKTD